MQRIALKKPSAVRSVCRARPYSCSVESPLNPNYTAVSYSHIWHSCICGLTLVGTHHSLPQLWACGTHVIYILVFCGIQRISALSRQEVRCAVLCTPNSNANRIALSISCVAFTVVRQRMVRAAARHLRRPTS